MKRKWKKKMNRRKKNRGENNQLTKDAYEK
jgi:hypothetical protein